MSNIGEELGLVAFDEQVVLECGAARKGQEQKSSSGIILGTLSQGEIPLYGTVVSVGENCPEYIKEIIGRDIPLPQGGGIYSNVPDPRMAYGEIPRSSVDARIFLTMHYKGVRAVYNHKHQEQVHVNKLEQSTKSTLTLIG